MVEQATFTYTMSVMEKERQQSLSGKDHGREEETTTTSATNCKSADSRDDTPVKEPATEPQAESVAEPASEPQNESESEQELQSTMMAQTICTPCGTIENQQKLKLIVRSQYWGRELKGRTCRNVYTHMNNRAPLVVTTQAVLYNTDNTDGFWGCCPNHGKRVLELQEYHFTDASEDFYWDLYLVGTWFVSPSQQNHDFFLLPQNQTQVDIERNIRMNGWTYFGTCNRDMIRSGIDGLLRDILLQNDAFGHRYHHVHIDIMMDKAFDRETPRSRKINNERARAERKKNAYSPTQTYDRQESSITTDATESTEHESQPPPPPPSNPVTSSNKPFPTKVVGAAPPIPRYISNDMAYVVPMTHSVANTMVGYQDMHWTRNVAHLNHNQQSVPFRPGLMSAPVGHFVNGRGEHHGLQWSYQAKGVVPVTGAMSQHPSYWQQTNGAQFATAPPHSYYHPREMQMHQYPVGVQHTPLPSEFQHYNTPLSENTYYDGMNNTPDNSFGGNPSMIFREGYEGSNMESIPYSLHNVSTSDGSVPPQSPPEVGSSPPSASTGPKIVDAAKVSPIAASSEQSGEASPPTLDTGV